ncbi:hypothetical protein E2C01_073155 [Portunus trituberculatus]|uniref:Uncharacterized protein n=1 Tax=Portunus trituberculatus TaxID=210409 RepID=A0A5B7I014_PORTR|nr:hypothetical protein [Portunus trituberculatus]
MDSRRLLYLSFSIIFLSASLTQALDKIPGIGEWPGELWSGVLIKSQFCDQGLVSVDPGRGRDGMPGQHPHPREATPSPHQAEAKGTTALEYSKHIPAPSDHRCYPWQPHTPRSLFHMLACLFTQFLVQ